MNNLEKFKYKRSIQYTIELVEDKKSEKNNTFFYHKKLNNKKIMQRGR